jgi:hypothetical protein
MTNLFYPRLVLSLIATGITIYGYFPYFRDVFAKKTQPHMYTWLIWMITQGTATVGILKGGGGLGSIGWIVGTLLVVVMFLFTFKYGTKNIHPLDGWVLAAALSAIVVWWQLHNPMLAVIMVSVIDGLGYIPTLRKSFAEPWSETVLYWFLMALASLLTIASLEHLNLLTLLYPLTLGFANIIVCTTCYFRRKIIPGLPGVKTLG